MSVPLGKRKKVVLLRSAMKRGWRPFFHQAAATFSDTFLARTHIIYRADAADVLIQPVPDIAGLAFREVKSWEDLSAGVRTRLLADQGLLNWGDPSWFDRGWRLWAGEFGEELATLSWWRAPSQSDDFFYPIPADGELMWQSTTMPEHRGDGLFTVQRLNLMRDRIGDGVQKFFVCCENFNSTGRRNLPKQGFKPIGISSRSKITGQRRFRPLPPGTVM
jgi:hypothetical protein